MLYGTVDEHRLDPGDLAAVDLEQLEQREAVREVEHRLGPGGAVGPGDVDHFARMVDEAAGQDQALLLVDQREAAVAQAVVVDVLPLAELLGAIHRRDRVIGHRGVVGRLQPVLDPVAAFGELGEQLPVVQLQGVEIAVGDRDHPRARRAARSGHVLAHHRPRGDVALDVRERPEFRATGR